MTGHLRTAGRMPFNDDMRQAAHRKAVRRGWLAENIEAVSSNYALEDGPPLMAETVETIERIRAAPILPVRDTPTKPHRERYTNKRRAA